MLKIIARFFVREEEIDKAAGLIKSLVQKTRKEDGCITYEVFQDEKNKGHFVFIEEWESQEQLNLHAKTSDFLNFVPAMAELQDGDRKPVIESYSKLY